MNRVVLASFFALVALYAGGVPSVLAQRGAAGVPLSPTEDASYALLEGLSGACGHNLDQALAICVAGRGAEVEDLERHASWRAQLSLDAFGRSGSAHEVASSAALRVDHQPGANRVTLSHGSVREWYVNGPHGLQQGFDVAAAPPGAGSLEFVIAVQGLRPESRGPQRIALLEGNVERVSYNTLRAWDADGDVLPSEMRVRDGRIVLHVDDRGARYPLVVDPYVQQQRVAHADPTPNDLFGFSVAIAGDTALIGAYGDDEGGSATGSVFVFERVGGVWTQEAQLTASDRAAGDVFGRDVALSGEMAVIGAPQNDDAGSQSGSAYVFVRNAGVWTQAAKLLPADGAAGDLFGASVAIAGTTVVVGAAEHDGGGINNSGAAYVFVEGPAGWAQQAKLVAGSPSPGDFFGTSVALSGDTALVGADSRTAMRTGSARVFVRSGVTWTQEATLLASDGLNGDRFGFSVALDGDTALVGAPLKATAAGDTGAAYLFDRSGVAWSQTARLMSSDPDDQDRFGNWVALSGASALVAASFDDEQGADAGAVYTFARGASGWSQGGKLMAQDGSAGDHFGRSVALDGDTALIGAPDVAGVGVSTGAAYFFVVVGAACSASEECASGHCVDGVCCNMFCGGGAADCQTCAAPGAVGVCSPSGAGFPCRAAAGDCDVAETCDGFALDCPADTFATSDVTCRAAADVCDRPETCSGAAATCPADGFLDTNALCRPSAGDCDVPEFCPGSGPACVPDLLAGAGTACRAAAGDCDVAEVCTGVSALCPEDAFLAAGDVCRPSAAACDAAETCTGASGNCPPDLLASAGTVCRAPAGECDVAETCSGSALECPADEMALAGTACGDTSTSACSAPDACDGSGVCLAHHAASGTPCEAGSFCRVGDQCMAGACVEGAAPACALDQKCDESADACYLACGDGVLDAGEACDNGALNSNVMPGACRMDCTLARCGDGVVDAGEGCDEGSANSSDPGATCNTLCAPPGCGDGVLDSAAGELCDAGAANADSPDAPCRPTCVPPSCGDGVADVAAGEECDDGAMNSDSVPDACRRSCEAAYCGDGVVDIGEDCDGAGPNDTCSADCSFVGAGDAGPMLSDAGLLDGGGQGADVGVGVDGGMGDAGAGCGCHAVGSSARGTPWSMLSLAMLGWLALRRRRRAQSRPCGWRGPRARHGDNDSHPHADRGH